MGESANQIFERDSILLYCTEKKGFLYVGTDNPSNTALSLHPVKNPRNPQFPYLAFAVFKLCVVPKSETKQKKDDGNPLVFGRLVKLINIASQKFVTLSTKSKLYLQSGEKDSSVFIIQSPQGAASRGKDVCLGSEILLESANNRGACLLFDCDVTTKSMHAHLKEGGMKFVVYRHAKESELSDELLLAGKPVMLHNLKRDGELSANSCFLRTDGDESDRTVECRRRTKVHGVERTPPQSGDTFWQLELMDAPYRGRPLKWNDRCRIQHLPSQLYVTVVKVTGIDNIYQLQLRELHGEDRSRNESFILMHPTDDDASGTISHTDNLVFQHEITGRRIAVPVTTKEIDLRHRFYSNNRRLNVFTVQKNTMSGMTVFLVDQITKVVVFDFYSATVWASSLHKVAKMLRISKSVNFDYMMRFNDCMSSVVSWIQEGQMPSRRADMLRTLHVVEVLYDLLRDCCELVDGSEDAKDSEDPDSRASRYKVILQITVDVMKKFIQIAKPKTRRYFIQDEILKPLFLKPTSRAAIQDFLSVLVKIDTLVAEKMSDFIFKHDLAATMQVERESQGFLMALSSNNLSKNASHIQNLLFTNMQNYPLGNGRTPEDDVQLETVTRSAETIAQYSGTTIDRFWKTFEFEKLTLSEPWRGAGVRSAFKRVEKPDVIQAMQRNIIEHLRANETIHVSKDSVQKNSYTSQLLRMLESLVNYGFYSAEDQLKMIPHLLYILDGSTDIVTGHSQAALERYKDTNENRPVIKIKNDGVLVLQKFHNMLVYISLERLLYDFKYLLEQADFRLEEFPGGSHWVRGLQEHLHLSFSEDIPSSLQTTYHHIAPPKSLTDLLDTSTIGITDRVQAHAKERLDALFDNDSYSIFDISSSQGKHLVRVLLDLLNYNDGELCLSAAQLLFDMHCKGSLILNSARDAYLVDPVMSGFMNKVLPLASMSDEEKILHKMLHGIVQPEANPQLFDTLDELCIDCVKQSDENEPAISHQAILYSSGLFLLLLDYVMKYGPSNDKSHIECKMRCYELMRRIARKNPKVQFRIYQDLTDVMKEKVCVFAMAELLTEVFSYNKKICVMVCEVDTGLKEFLTEAISSAHCDQHELVHVMNVVVMGNPRCKDQVAKLIKDACDSDLSHLLHKDRATRMQLLCLKHDKVSDEDRSNLCLLLNIVDVLATCCHGEFLKNEVIAEEIISFDEILEIISHPRIPLENKKPFTALLNWGFLDTERKSLQYLKQYVNFKQHLEDVTLLINAFIEDSQQINLREVHKNLKALGKRHLSVAGWMKYCCNSPVVTITSCDHSTSLNGMLLYLLQGLIPLITVLSVKLEHLDVFPEMILVLKGFGESLMNFQRLLLNQTEHAKITMACLNGIESMLHRNLPTDVHVGFMLGLQRSRLSVQSMQPGDVKNNCALLNDKLQEYVTNYWIACGGIPSKDDADKMYTFPIGPNFDKLVDLFDRERNNDDHENVNIKNLLKLLEIIYAKIHLLIRGTERSELDRLLFITLQIVVTLLQRKVDMVEHTEACRMRREVYEKHLEPLQGHLLKLRAHEKTMKHLSHSSERVSYQVITIMKQLLFFGNTQAQQLIGGLLSSDKSDVLFSKFRTILEGVSRQLMSYKGLPGPIPLELSIEPKSASSSRRTSSAVPLSPSAIVHYFKRNMSIHGTASDGYTPLTASFQFASLQEEDEDDNVDKRKTESTSVSPVKTSPQAQVQDSTADNPVANTEDLEASKTVDANDEETLLQAFEDVNPATCKRENEVNVVLDVVSFLCDGQQKKLQDTFGREMPQLEDSSIMNHIIVLLEGVADSIDHKNIKTAKKAFQALIELCAGNFRNQQLAFRLQALASINSFLKIDPQSFDLDLQSEIMLVKCSTVELLEVMLEETDPSSSELARKIYAQLSFKNLLTTMVQVWNCYNKSTCKTDKSFWRNGLLRCYHTIKMIAYYTGAKPDAMVKDKFRHVFGRKNSDVEAMLFFCREWSHSIEIEYKPKGILTRVYFPYSPEQHLELEDKKWVCDNLMRDSEGEKLRDLLQWIDSLRKRSLWKTKVNNYLWLKWVPKFLYNRHILLIFLTFVLNLLLLFAIAVSRHPPSSYSTGFLGLNITNITEQRWYYPKSVAILGTFHLLLSAWMVAEFYINEYPHIRCKSRILEHLLWYLNRRTPKFTYLLNKLFYHLFKRHFTISKPQPYSHFERPLLDAEAAYRVLFLLISFLALFFHGTLYPLCMYYIFIKSDVARTVLTSVKRSATALVVILSMVLMVLVIYAVVAFFFFNRFFQAGDSLNCRNMFRCLITVIKLGLLSNPPLGDNIDTFSGGGVTDVVHLLYGVSFFIIVTTLGLNIVTAILVDNFSALREKKNEVKQDMKNVCTICGLTKSFFDHNAKMQGGFRGHIKEDHSMWNYIYFALYLEYRDKNDYNALEKYIFESMRDHEIDFFPQGKAKGIIEE